MKYTKDDYLEARASAVMKFADEIVSAFEAGFTSGNNASIAEIYQTARGHVKTHYSADTNSLSDKWGETTARRCSSEKEKSQ